MIGQRGASLLAIVLAAAGCGRWNFEEQPSRDGGADADQQPDVLLDEPLFVFVCPAGFIEIAGEPALGTDDFCIMQFEAKAWLDTNADAVVDAGEIVTAGCDFTCSANNLSTYTPVAVPDANPWFAISATLAQDRCRSLGPHYDLLSNREWMTVARLAERNAANWSSGTPGTGRMYEGSTYGATSVIATLGDPYAGAGHSAADPVGSG